MKYCPSACKLTAAAPNPASASSASRNLIGFFCSVHLMCLQAQGLLLVNKPPLMYKHERLPSLSVCKIVSHSLELLKYSLSVWSLQYVERSSRWSRITLRLPALCHTLPCRGRSGAVTKHSPYNHQRCTTDILKLSYYQAI